MRGLLKSTCTTLCDEIYHAENLCFFKCTIWIRLRNKVKTFKWEFVEKQWGSSSFSGEYLKRSMKSRNSPFDFVLLIQIWVPIIQSVLGSFNKCFWQTEITQCKTTSNFTSNYRNDQTLTDQFSIFHTPERWSPKHNESSTEITILDGIIQQLKSSERKLHAHTQLDVDGSGRLKTSLQRCQSPRKKNSEKSPISH